MLAYGSQAIVVFVSYYDKVKRLTVSIGKNKTFVKG